MSPQPITEREAERQGYEDARRGIHSCPFQRTDLVEAWQRGQMRWAMNQQEIKSRWSHTR
jgi:hypothetical protein